jgi:ferritin-like metal-binding protein YciE
MMDNLQELFEVTVRLTYNAEKRFLKAMPKLLKTASNEKLKAAINHDMERTPIHLKRLEQIAKKGNFRPTGKVCKTAKCLVEENDALLAGEARGATLDAAVIVCAQRKKHYGICAYGTLVAWAVELGNPDITECLEDTLKEHSDADELYSKISRRINTSANSLIPVLAVEKAQTIKVKRQA